jgi:hypothetical protein
VDGEDARSPTWNSIRTGANRTSRSRSQKSSPPIVVASTSATGIRFRTRRISAAT